MDVLAVEKEKCTIFDWKTTKKPSTMDDYAKSPQTRLYLFILRHCIARFLSLKPDGVQPNQIDMVYWFPNAENQQITLHYSEEQYQSDAVWLKEMAKLLSVDDPMKYPETTNLKQCLTCRYFSFCRKEAYPSTEDEFPDDDASLNSGLPDNEVQSAGDEDQPEIIF